jgi:hypothetical protein
MTLRAHRAWWALALLVCALLVGGCGGGGSSSSSSTTASAAPASKATFLKEADAKCERVAIKLSKSLSSAAERMVAGGGAMTRKGEEKLLSTISAPAFAKLATELSHLEAPAAQEEKFDAMVEGFATAAKQVEEDPAAALRENPVTAPTAKAVALELTACSEL